MLHRPFEEEDVVSVVRTVFTGRIEFYDGEATVAPGISVHKVGALAGHSGRPR
jgi:hypothetical protein